MIRGRSWMLFVDGENLSIRAQDYAQSTGLALTEGKYFSRDHFIWIPGQSALSRPLAAKTNPDNWGGIRAYYYTSVCGDEPLLEEIRSQLWALDFTPKVFKKSRKNEKAKGVDISLTKDMLSHAFLEHYEIAVLVAGDGDYVPLVEAVKDRGKRVSCSFFADYGMNKSLMLACDEFWDLTPTFLSK